MTTEELATIISTGDVPLSLRMSVGNSDSSNVRQALKIRQSGRYDGMSYAQVLAKLKENKAEADAVD